MKYYFTGKMVYWYSRKLIIFNEGIAATMDAGTVPMDSVRNDYDFLMAAW